MDNTDNSNEITYIRRLPHIQTANRPIFLTWRLAFNLPKAVLSEMKQMKADFENSIKELSKDYQNIQRFQYDIKQFKWYDTQLANPDLPDVLLQTNIANIVQEALEYYHETRYELLAYSVMPNHVHVLIQLLMVDKGIVYPLAKITQNWKRYSAKQINQLLEREGTFWQAESYDHVIRNEKEYGHFIQYILDNPVNAGLVTSWQDWKYTWLNPKIKL